MSGGSGVLYCVYFLAILPMLLLQLITANRQIPKVIGQVLELPPCHNCPDNCLWLHYGEIVPQKWVQSDGTLLLPDDDWSVFGTFRGQCEDGTSVSYVITNPGEYCSNCLSLSYTPPVNQLCIGYTIHVNTSTQQPHPHNGATSVLINNNIDSDIMKCSLVEGSDPRNPNVSYVCTAKQSANISLTAHTTYHGAEWSSSELHITIVEMCTVTEITHEGTSTSVHPQSTSSLLQQRNATPVEPSSTVRSAITTDTASVAPSNNENGTKVDDKDDNEHFSTAAIVVIVLLILVIAGGVIMFIFLWNRDKFPVCSKYKSKDVITPSTASDEGMDNDGDHIVIPSQDNMQENRPRQRLTSSLSKNIQDPVTDELQSPSTFSEEMADEDKADQVLDLYAN